MKKFLQPTTQDAFRLLLCCWLFLPLALKGQTDSTKILPPEMYLSIIKKYHPLAKQADLLSEQAKADLRIARGGFDPILHADYDRKEFSGKNYYSFFNSELKIPAWYGIEVKTGYDYYYGININPENNLPDNGMYFLGISVPLLKSMLMDKKRAALMDAKLFVKATEQERLLLLNELLFDALQTYYNWCEAEQIKTIYQNALRVAEIRYKATVRAFQLGDRPAIDTTEALAQFQQRQFQLNEANLSVQKSKFLLSNFLWTENGDSYLLPADIRPIEVDSQYTHPSLTAPLESIEQISALISQQHPSMSMYDIKLQQLALERRLKKEDLKPTLNVNYNLLSPGFFSYINPDNRIFSNYYKIGVNFSMPLTFAQGRAELSKNTIKTKSVQADRVLKQRELETKLMTVYAEMVQLKEQIALFRATYGNYLQLYKGEARRLELGESNLFLVNTRENTAITSEQKLTELYIKYVVTEAKMKWIMATLF